MTRRWEGSLSSSSNSKGSKGGRAERSGDRAIEEGAQEEEEGGRRKQLSRDRVQYYSSALIQPPLLSSHTQQHSLIDRSTSSTVHRTPCTSLHPSQSAWPGQG